MAAKCVLEIFPYKYLGGWEGASSCPNVVRVQEFSGPRNNRRTPGNSGISGLGIQGFTGVIPARVQGFSCSDSTASV